MKNTSFLRATAHTV